MAAAKTPPASTGRGRRSPLYWIWKLRASTEMLLSTRGNHIPLDCIRRSARGLVLKTQIVMFGQGHAVHGLEITELLFDFRPRWSQACTPRVGTVQPLWISS